MTCNIYSSTCLLIYCQLTPIQPFENLTSLASVHSECLAAWITYDEINSGISPGTQCDRDHSSDDNDCPYPDMCRLRNGNSNGGLGKCTQSVFVSQTGCCTTTGTMTGCSVSPIIPTSGSFLPPNGDCIVSVLEYMHRERHTTHA